MIKYWKRRKNLHTCGNLNKNGGKHRMEVEVQDENERENNFESLGVCRQNNSILNIFLAIPRKYPANKNLSPENIIRQTQFRIRQELKLKKRN